MIDNSFQQARESIASDPSTLGIPVISGERLALFSEPHIIYDREIDDSWIAGSSTNAIVGTWTGTAGGGQLVVGGTDNTETLLRVIPVQGTYINALRATKANESGRGLVGPWAYQHIHFTLDNTPNDYYGVVSGTASNVTYTTGKINDAAVFNGSNAQIAIGASNSLITNDSAWTISFWWNPDAFLSDSRMVNLMTTAGNSAVRIRAIPGTLNSLFVGMRNSGGTIVETEIKNTLGTGVWYHFALTYDGTTWRGYLNNVLEASNTQTFSGFNTGTAYIGSGGGFSYFDGMIEDLRFYNRTLSADEVSSLYNSNSGVGPSWIDTTNNVIYLGSSGQVVWRAALGDNTFNSVIPNLDVDADRTNMVFGSTAFVEVSSDLSSWTTLTNKVRNSISSSSTLYWRLRGAGDNLTWQTKDDRSFEVPVVIRFLEV